MPVYRRPTPPLRTPCCCATARTAFPATYKTSPPVGDTLYALTYDAVYAFEGESAEPARYELSLPAETEAENGVETSSSLDAIAIVSCGGALCLLAARTEQTVFEEDGETIWESAIDGVSLYALDLVGDTATTGAEVCALDWEDLILGGADDAYLAEVDALCAAGDFLACRSYDESGNEFYAIADLTDGSVALYYADELPGEDALLTPYRDGELLCITREWGSEGNLSRIHRFDPASGATDELCALSTGEGYLEAPAYRAESDTLYYLLDGQLWALPGMDASQSEAVAGFPLDSPRGQAALTASGLYAAADFFTLVRRDTDPAQRASVRLAVLSGHSENVENAAYAFGAERGDVEVTLVQQSGDVLEAMLSRSPEIDVYCFSASLPQYEALRARGFLPSLDGLTNVCSFVESCYPFARDACTVDGAVVALPVEVGFNAPLSYDAGALAKLGLTEDDLPATWPEFFLALHRFPQPPSAPGCTFSTRSRAGSPCATRSLTPCSPNTPPTSPKQRTATTRRRSAPRWKPSRPWTGQISAFSATNRPSPTKRTTLPSPETAQAACSLPPTPTSARRATWLRPACNGCRWAFPRTSVRPSPPTSPWPSSTPSPPPGRGARLCGNARRGHGRGHPPRTFPGV